MTLNQLIYFEMLAEMENMRKAAEKLYISQPSLSVSMAKLEQELQVDLFLHQGRRVELTDAGHLFLEHVKKILKDIQEARIHMERLGAAGALVEHSMGYAIIPYVGEMEKYRITVHEIPEVIIRNTCVAMMKNDHTIGITAKRFISFILERRVSVLPTEPALS